MEQHMTMRHKEYHCGHCGKMVEGKAAHKIHVRNCQTGVWKCSFCKKVYESEEYLQVCVASSVQNNFKVHPNQFKTSSKTFNFFYKKLQINSKLKFLKPFKKLLLYLLSAIDKNSFTEGLFTKAGPFYTKFLLFYLKCQQLE